MTNRVSNRAEIEISDDGRPLIGDWWPSNADEVRATVVIAPAMATKASFYHGFAQWLSDRGFDVLTFDYRGYGASAGGLRLRDVTATALDWAQDARAASACARARSADRPVLYLGHSFGGHVLPFIASGDIDGALLVSSGSGFWQCNTPRVRWFTPALWGFLSPALIRLTGYFPGKRIGVIGDLPPNVMAQWSRWCLNARYIVSESAHVAGLYEHSAVPTTSIWFTDDEILAARSFSDFASFLPGSRPTLVKVSPKDLRVDRIGHHGIFHRSLEEIGWSQLLLGRVEQAIGDIAAQRRHS
jgi:predicted alpha/beta hydrolase